MTQPKGDNDGAQSAGEKDAEGAGGAGDADTPGEGDRTGSPAPGPGTPAGPEVSVPTLTIEDAIGVVVTESGARYEDVDWPVAISSALNNAQRSGLAQYERTLEAVGVLVGLPHKSRVSVEVALATLWPETAIKNQIIGYLKGKAVGAREAEEQAADDLEKARALNSRATRFELAAEALAEE